MVTRLPWQPQGYDNNSSVSSHIEITFGMEVLWDDKHQPLTSLPRKLQHCRELNMTNVLLIFHSGCHGNQNSIAMRYEGDVNTIYLCMHIFIVLIEYQGWR